MISIDIIDTPVAKIEKPFIRREGPGTNLLGIGEQRNIIQYAHEHHADLLNHAQKQLRFFQVEKCERSHGKNKTAFSSGWLFGLIQLRSKS